MMVMKGGLPSRMEVMESLSDFTDACESVLRACEKLEAYYENIKDSGNSVLFRRNWMQLRRISPKSKQL